MARESSQSPDHHVEGTVLVSHDLVIVLCFHVTRLRLVFVLKRSASEGMAIASKQSSVIPYKHGRMIVILYVFGTSIVE